MSLLAVLALACSGDDEETGTDQFRVIGVVPADGAVDALSVQIPELRFSASADPATCDTDAVRLDAVRDDGTVAFAVPVTLVPVDQGAKLQLDHADPMPGGWRYAITVRTGAAGCTDVDGREIVPFASTFEVP